MNSVWVKNVDMDTDMVRRRRLQYWKEQWNGTCTKIEVDKDFPIWTSNKISKNH